MTKKLDLAQLRTTIHTAQSAPSAGLVMKLIQELEEARARHRKAWGRAEAAEQALDFHTQRDRELKTLLSVLADRLDEFCYDELSSLIEDEPLNQWSEKYTSKLQAAEAAAQRVRDAIKDAPTSDPTSGRTGPPDDWPDDGELIGQGEFLVAERVRRALDGGEQE